jgi:hypothetical protein
MAGGAISAEDSAESGTMRFMVLVKSGPEAEAGVLPDERMLSEMGAYNDELIKAGVMLAGEGLHASAKGARVTYAKGKLSVVDGPFAEAKELVAGFWLIQAKSKDEAVAWLKKTRWRAVGHRLCRGSVPPPLSLAPLAESYRSQFHGAPPCERPRCSLLAVAVLRREVDPRRPRRNVRIRDSSRASHPPLGQAPPRGKTT